MNKNLLVIGSGGRCHAIVSALRKSAEVDKIYAAPGNAGIADDAQCVNIKENEIDALLSWAQNHAIDMTIVGPELPLSLGIADKFNEAGMRIFAPSKMAARIETSKAFAKTLMQQYSIPTAAYQVFEQYQEALAYAERQPLPIVIKYDGLAAGKGVVVAHTQQEAREALHNMLALKQFGNGKVLIEECLQGKEFSLMCMVNGSRVYALEAAQDYKRAYNNDQGPNTGGMGACSPVPMLTEQDINYAMTNIMQRAADAMCTEGYPFCGALYGGLIKTKEGIKVIEFNARMGDPETEVVLMRLASDFYAMVKDVMEGRKPVIAWKPQCCVGITLATEGYPHSHKMDYPIYEAENLNAQVFHMGTKRNSAGQLLGAGGRALLVAALADSIEQARTHILTQIHKIDCHHLFYRSDIGCNAG
jgi:phosphoribosylamine--glycine ligase